MDFFKELYTSYFDQTHASFYEPSERDRLATFLIESNGLIGADIMKDAIKEIESNAPETVLDCINMSMANGILQENRSLRSEIEFALTALITVIEKTDPAHRCNNRLEWIERLRAAYTPEECFRKACFCYASGNVGEAREILEENAAHNHFPSMKSLIPICKEQGDYGKVLYYASSIERIMRVQYHIEAAPWINRIITHAQEQLSAEERNDILEQVQSLTTTSFRGGETKQKTIRGFAVES